jgi:hypothetical protein
METSTRLKCTVFVFVGAKHSSVLLECVNKNVTLYAFVRQCMTDKIVYNDASLQNGVFLNVATIL